MLISLDVATKTGYALYDGKHPSAIRAGSFECIGDTPEQKAASLAAHLIRLIKGPMSAPQWPTFAVIEQPQRNVQQFRKQGTRMMPEASGGLTINAGTALQLNQLTGAAVAVLTGFRIPWETIPVSTWRKAFFGKGTKAGSRQEWKRMAREQCRLLRIDVPNTDAAEAVGIAVAGAGLQTWRAMQAKAAA